MQKWENTTDTFQKFEFFKAFLVDKNFATVYVEPYYEEMLGCDASLTCISPQRKISLDLAHHPISRDLHVWIPEPSTPDLKGLLCRLSENVNAEKFTELPLCLIQEQYSKLPGGAKFIEELQSSNYPS